MTDCPGWGGVPTMVTRPDKSVAVGTVQKARSDVIPNSTIISWLSGQPVIVGGVVSTIETQIWERKTNLSGNLTLGCVN